MKYKSELIKDIVDTGGHKKSSLHYESECIGAWIEETKGAYPKLCDYESEWLNYITSNNEIGKFPYETVTANPTATINNVVPYEYKSAILRGNTLVNLAPNDTFEGSATNRGQEFTLTQPVQPNKQYILLVNITKDDTVGGWHCRFTDGVNYPVFQSNIKGVGLKKVVFTTSIALSKFFPYFELEDCEQGRYITMENVMLLEYQQGMENWDIPYFEGMQSVKMPVLTTSNGDGTKTNILTVNEEVELCGIGDVKDELNLLTGELTTRIREVVYNSTDIIIGKYPNKENTFNLFFDDKSANTRSIMVDKIPVMTEWPSFLNNINLSCSSLQNSYLYVTIPNVNTIEEAKTYLSNLNPTFLYILAEESIKTVDLSVTDQDGNTLSRIKPIEGTMHISTEGTPIKPAVSMEVPVEAITQNLASFIKGE